jgi:hypothetical protein
MRTLLAQSSLSALAVILRTSTLHTKRHGTKGVRREKLYCELHTAHAPLTRVLSTAEGLTVRTREYS